ncbi:MAG: DegT/DnrJ/EryC1/StrS aminotransferase family protein [Bacteroidales bacterium]
MNIRLFKPSIGNEELENIKKVFDREWLGLGPTVSQFEKEWNDYVGTKMSIGVNSATAALHLALMAYKFPRGKKVLVPAITFAATATAVLYNDLVPVFVDVDRETSVMDLEDLKRKYTSDCVAVIPVHNGGYPVPMEKLMPFAKEKNLVVIEDCAHCAGGEYLGKKLGTYGDIGCFSFEEKKCMTTGDGGMICSNHVEIIEPLRAQRWVGIDKDTWKRTQSTSETLDNEAMHWHYEIALLGYKYNMNDVAAAIGLAQLHKLDAMNLKRRDIIRKYLDGIANLKTITPIFPYDRNHGAYWYFAIRSQHRDELIVYLKNQGIATGVHFYPLVMQPLFKKYDIGCEVAKEIWKTFITLPSHVDLTNEELDFILKALKEFDSQK